MAHRLLHKLSFSRNRSVSTSSTICPGVPSGNATVPGSQESPLCSSGVTRTSPTVHAHYSNPPMPLVALPPPDFSLSPGIRRSGQRVNLFKKLFGKQPAPLRLTASKIRSSEALEKDLQELRLNAGAETRDGNSRKSSPKVETPTSWELHWDCANTEYRDSMEVRTPVFSNQGLALCDLPSPTDMLGPIDYRSVCRRVKSPMPREVPSPRRRSNDAKDAYPPTGRSPPSPSGSSIGDATSTNTHEQNVVISHASSSPNEAEPGLAGPLFRHPRRERETRRVSLVLRPASSGGPALQTLSPPPVKVNLAVRRGTTVPSRLPPAPPPRRRSHRSIERSQLPYESAHNVSEPGAPTSITPEEGLIQLQARTQQTDSNTRLGYRRSFKHIRGLSPRTRPTSALPQISTVSVPISTHPDYSDDAAIVTISEGSLIGLITQSSSDESGSLSTPPDDAIPDITITRSRKGSDAPSDPLHFSSRARAGKYASSFLDFEPGTPRSPLSPATQSPFSVAQSQLLTCCGSSSPKCVDGPTEQSDADTSTNSDEEQEQGDWGARTGASPIRIPGVSDSSMRGSKARPSLLRLGIPYIESGNSVYIRDANVGGSGITGAYHTRAVGQSQRRRKSGARRSHRPRSKSGTTTSLRSYNMASGETISAIRGVGVFIEISSRMTDRRRSPSRMV